MSGAPGTNRATITAIILTRNEEINLPACIRSIQGLVDRIIVVDSYSEDATVELARGFGADVFVHEFVNYGAQFQYALDTCDIDTDWVLRIDADERMTEASAAEMVALCNENLYTDINGIVMCLTIHFMGKELKHGEAVLRKLCIFKPSKAYMEVRYMDEQIVLTEGRSVVMKNRVEHHDYKDLSYWITKHNWYATRAARDYLENRNRDANELNVKSLDFPSKVNRFVKYGIYYKLPSRLRTWLYFFYRYVVRGGFLDGRPGYWYAFFQAYWYRVLVDAKIYEATELGQEIGETGAVS